jgi:hypothetical protein
VIKVEQVESELRNGRRQSFGKSATGSMLSIEDALEFTPEFEDSIQRSERDMAAGEAAFA